MTLIHCWCFSPAHYRTNIHHQPTWTNRWSIRQLKDLNASERTKNWKFLRWFFFFLFAHEEKKRKIKVCRRNLNLLSTNKLMKRKNMSNRNAINNVSLQILLGLFSLFTSLHSTLHDACSFTLSKLSNSSSSSFCSSVHIKTTSDATSDGKWRIWEQIREKGSGISLINREMCKEWNAQSWCALLGHLKIRSLNKPSWRNF